MTNIPDLFSKNSLRQF